MVACAEQALGMLATLCAPVQLALRLRGVRPPGAAAAAPEGPATHTAVVRQRADPALPPLQRLHAGQWPAQARRRAFNVLHCLGHCKHAAFDLLQQRTASENARCARQTSVQGWRQSTPCIRKGSKMQ